MSVNILDLRSNTKAGVRNDPIPGFGIFYENGHFWVDRWQWVVRGHDLRTGQPDAGGWEAPSVISADVDGGVDLGADPFVPLAVAAHRELARRVGIAENLLPGTDIRDILSHFICGSLADATGGTRQKPIRPNARARVELWMGTDWGKVLDEKIGEGHPNLQATLDVRWADYRRAKARGVRLQALRRWTGFDARLLFGREPTLSDLDRLLPPEHISDGWERPQTIFTESWPTNSTDLTTGQDQAWTELVGGSGGRDLEVAGGVLRVTAATSEYGLAVCDTNLSSDDHSHEATVVLGTDANFILLMTRYDGGSDAFEQPNNCYQTQPYRETGFHERFMHRWVSAARTRIDTDGDTNDPGTGIVVKNQADGSTIGGAIGAFTFANVTDANITGNLQVGIGIRAETAIGNGTTDAHTAQDVAVANPKGPLSMPIGRPVVGPLG